MKALTKTILAGVALFAISAQAEESRQVHYGYSISACDFHLENGVQKPVLKSITNSIESRNLDNIEFDEKSKISYQKDATGWGDETDGKVELRIATDAKSNRYVMSVAYASDDGKVVAKRSMVGKLNETKRINGEDSFCKTLDQKGQVLISLIFLKAK